MNSLDNKKILFIGLDFYDYEIVIKAAIEKRGAMVGYICSIDRSFISRLLTRLALYDIVTKRNQRKRTALIVKSSWDNDIVFVIKGEQLTEKDMLQLKKQNPNADFILYLWDSLVRHNNLDMLFKYFQNIWSFDRKDCESNSRLKFRPLFYRKKINRPKKYYISFIGVGYLDRLNTLRTLYKELKNKNLPFHFKIRMGYLDYLQNRYIYKNITKEDKALLAFLPIPYAQFQEIIASSTIVLDMAHPSQDGLTMRTIEALVNGSFLLTTNRDILNYPQITPNLYKLLDMENPKLLDRFEEERVQIPEDFLSYFSLDCFVSQIFELI
jgi:hypothetical protein